MVVKHILERARRLLAFGWCQRREAKNAKGEAVEPTSPQACQWCLLGAIMAASEKQGVESYRRALWAFAPSLRLSVCDVFTWEWLDEQLRQTITAFNDGKECTQEKVLELVDETLRRFD